MILMDVLETYSGQIKPLLVFFLKFGTKFCITWMGGVLYIEDKKVLEYAKK